MKYTIGIDLGGTTMTAGLVDEPYNIVGKITRPTRLLQYESVPRTEIVWFVR